MLPTTVNEFQPMPKIARLNRDCVITEKLDGTNASVNIYEDPTLGWVVQAGSRTRWLTPEDDNYGFAAWVYDHAEALCTGLGAGHHFGEWWGRGIGRTYGLTERRFSLFNTERWQHIDARPACCDVVPVLYEGEFSTHDVDWVIAKLKALGSYAVPGFMQPEGIVVYHTAAASMFKVTCVGDDKGKSHENHPKKERPPQQPRDKTKGGRRKADLPYEGVDKRANKN